MPAPTGGISYSQYKAITPSDSANLVGPINSASGASVCDAIFVGSIVGGATVTVVIPDGSTQAFTCIAGEILPVKAIRVNSTGTLASSLVALYF